MTFWLKMNKVNARINTPKILLDPCHLFKEYLQERNQYPQTSLRNKQMFEKSLWGGKVTLLLRTEWVKKTTLYLVYMICQRFCFKHVWLQRLHVNLFLQILDVFSIYSLQVSSFMHLYHHDALPIAFTQIFQTGNQIYQYSTRYSDFWLYTCRTNIKKFSVLFQGPRMWNSLLNNIKNSPTFNIFKHLIKPFLRVRQDTT